MQTRPCHTKTPRSILNGHQCDQCYIEQMKKPLRLSDGRAFESGAAAAKVLGVIKETVNKAVAMRGGSKDSRSNEFLGMSSVSSRLVAWSLQYSLLEFPSEARPACD